MSLKNTVLTISTAICIGLSSGSFAHGNDANDAAIQQALQVLEAQLPGKLLNNPYRIKWETHGSDRKVSLVKSEGAPGGDAYRIKVKKKKKNPWDTATRIPMTNSVAKDDVILISFWARAAKPQKGSETGDISVALQRNVEPYDSVVEQRIDLGQDWKLHSVSGKAKRDYAADKTNLNFNLAYAKQTIEFGQFYIMNLGPDGDASKHMGGN
jgi:hypothetical protein